MHPQRRARALARRQHGPISLRQLIDCGLKEEAVRHLVAKGLLHRQHHGVYAFDEVLSQDGRLSAAVLAGPPAGGAGFAVGAWLWGLRPSFPVRIELAVPGRGGSSGPKGIRVRHSISLTEADFVLRRGIRATSLERTIRDCSRTLGLPALRRHLQEAERQGFDIRLLDRPGIPRNLRRALDRYIRGSGWTANELEARFYEICVEIGVLRPRTQRSLDGGSMIIDFIWDDIGLIVETDGREGHGGWVAATEDRARDRRLFIEGYFVLRFTWAEVRWEPEMVKADLLAAVARLRRNPGSQSQFEA